MGPPAALTKRQSTYEPPVGKLSPDCFDLPFGDSAPGGIVWVVAVDGSTTSMRGVRLASFLMNAKAKDVSKGRDYVLVINVIKPGEAKPTALFGDCVEELRKCGLNVFKQVHCQTVERPDEWGVGDALVYFSNHVNMGHARLIIGGPGVHEAAVPGKSGKWKQLGSIAEQCLTKVKVPVVLVKGMWGTDPQGDRNAIGRPLRHGKDVATGLNISCCVDGTSNSDHAFDVATSLCRKGDSLTAVHVETTVDDAERAMHHAPKMDAKYEIECGKVGESMGLDSCIYKRVHASKSGSISEAIIDAASDCDLLVMGTIELMNAKKRHVLGSVAMHIAAAAQGHMLIVKNYAL